MRACSPSVLALLVLLLALSSFPIFVITFLYSPWLQNELIFMSRVDWPPSTFFYLPLIDLSTPMIEQWPWFHALPCAENIEVNRDDRFHLRGWLLKPLSFCDSSITKSSAASSSSSTASSSTASSSAESEHTTSACSIQSQWIVLYLHGNAENRAYQATLPRYQFFTSAPLCAQVVVFDYPGFADSTSLHALDESLMIDSALAMYDFVQSRVKPNMSLLVYGHSLGSSAATLFMARVLNRTHSSSSLPRISLILEGAFTNVVDNALSYVPELFAKDASVQHVFHSQIVSGLHSDRALSEIRHGIPVLLLHGTHDSVIGFWNAQELWRILSAQEEIVVFSHVQGNVSVAGKHALVSVDGAEHYDSITYSFARDSIIQWLMNSA